LSQSSEVLSSFTDTLYDEINAGHWDSSETEDSKSIIENTEEIKENPEAFVEGEFRNEGESEFMDLNPGAMNPSPEDYGMPESEEESDSGEESETGFSQQAASKQLDKFSHSLDKILLSHKSRVAGGNSSLPVSALPGPRVEHVGPGESVYGWVNDSGAVPSDDPSGDGFITDQPIYEDVAADGVTGYDNPTDGDNSYLKVASGGYSFLPGSDNSKLMPYYSRDMSDGDVEWMVVNSKPHNPAAPKEAIKRNNSKWVWEDV
jgi:hypothetical protein